jgi:hypothetical protein
MQFCPLRPHLPRLVGACVMLAAVVGFCRQGSAEFFQFSTTTTIGAVTPVGSTIMNNGTDFVTILTPVPATTPIQFTGLASTGPENLVATDGGTDLVFGLIDVLVVNATPLQVISIPFTFNVTITDYATDINVNPQGSGIFVITGNISGTIGAGRKVNMSNIVVNPVAPILIGNDLYSMTFNTIVPPGPFFPGAIGAHVEIVPEPATCAMLGMGLVGLAFPAVRRWRKKSA